MSKNVKIALKATNQFVGILRGFPAYKIPKFTKFFAEYGVLHYHGDAARNPSTHPPIARIPFAGIWFVTGPSSQHRSIADFFHTLRESANVLKTGNIESVQVDLKDAGVTVTIPITLQGKCGRKVDTLSIPDPNTLLVYKFDHNHKITALYIYADTSGLAQFYATQCGI